MDDRLELGRHESNQSTGNGRVDELMEFRGSSSSSNSDCQDNEGI